MAKITFYTHVADPLRFACQLTQKAYTQKARILVWLADAATAAQFDALLWSFDSVSFVPHQFWSPNTPQPDQQQGVLLATGDHLPMVAAETVVLNLADVYWCDAPQQPQRILELVGNDTDSIVAARQRFRAYRDAGFILEHHDMSSYEG
ncbi:DNA polymerase III subunit chi [Neisseriaceae bacterium ESL0693]|nr:DNA polymerase III subunit chi [Neisseriaceae bacterium ESL0693]